MNLNLYIIIATIISTISLVIFIVNDRDILNLSIIIKDISEALIIGGAWIVSMPVLVISHILLSIINIIKGE